MSGNHSRSSWSGSGHDAFDVLHHRKAERVRVEAREARIVEFGLEHHVGVRLQEFQEIAVRDPALLVQPAHDAVMHVGRGALVHHLGLALRIEILRDVPHDSHQLALPRLQARRGLFQEVQQIFLRQSEQRAAALDVQHGIGLGPPGRDGPPQVVERAFLVQAAFAGALLLVAQIELFLARIAIDPVRHQRMRGIERMLDRKAPVTLLALRHIAFCELEIVENAVGVGPLLEQIIVLEEMVVAEGGVRDHQRLHRRGVFLHQVGNARRRVDDDLVGETHQPLAVGRLVKGEMLAERPMLVEQRHADRGIGVQHLFRGDDLDLVGIDVEPQFRPRNRLAGLEDALQRREIPIRAFEQSFGCRGHDAAFSCLARRWNRS